MKKIGWFEIPVTDMARAKKFYESVLGEKLEDMEMGEYKFAMFIGDESEGQPQVGALFMGEGYAPSKEGVIIYFTTSDIDASLLKVTANGGDIVLPKKDIGDNGLVAWFIDTEGNRVAFHQAKKK